MNVFDVFCGCGGMSIGFKQAGLVNKFALDSNSHAAETFCKYHPETEFFNADANTFLEDLRGKSHIAPVCDMA